MSALRFERDAAVLHPTHGRGRVIVDDGATVVVRFEGRIEECLRGDLRPAADVAATEVRAGPPLRVLARVLAVAIGSVNDKWGVFSNSRVDLPPHQLWVCRRVLEAWPTRWLVADDVGLGKTIEAGLFLTPLVASGRVRRLLILAPASLVEQWQVRMREMFDLRLARYTAEADTPRSDFWGTHTFVVASAQTLRSDRNDRWKRLLESTPWDLVLVDEAHHVNSDERGGATLAYQLISEMEARRRIVSMVFFTGTPHRGKDFGFLALLKLLRPDQFDPKRPIEEQLERLSGVMIRNNKRVVTDMAGQPLFKPVHVVTETYTYSEAESRFYEMLTEYIQSGRAYASQLDAETQRTAMLVLIAMQKLASSSVAAVRQALTGRLARLRAADQRRTAQASDVSMLRQRLQQMNAADDPADADVRADLEEKIAAMYSEELLGPEEIPAIEQLLDAARAIDAETKIARIVQLIETRFEGRSVLLFTEYKATQALVLSALRTRFGEGCATFINGDGRIAGVRGADGREQTLTEDRAAAAGRFNRGDVRFLVSTEAAGEGIDLQRSCYSLIHVDLPWNPMRLHQRVGRLSRYGQRHPVDVVGLRNPDTVEGRIWECLSEKLARITQAFGSAMEDPEDMLQLVLGMSSPGEFERLFSEAREVPAERLGTWFDARSATFGGRKAIEAVREMVGHVARFDFGAARADLPQVDLPDLLPFFKAMLTHNGRRCEERDGAVSFITPDRWRAEDFAVVERYENMRFRRELPGDRDGGSVGGVGHRVVNAALHEAEAFNEVLAALPNLAEPIAVFVVRDRVTSQSGPVRRVLFGVAGIAGKWRLITDWALVRELNPLARRAHALTRMEGSAVGASGFDPITHFQAARAWFDEVLLGQPLPFQAPLVDAFALLIPAPAVDTAHETSE